MFAQLSFLLLSAMSQAEDAAPASAGAHESTIHRLTDLPNMSVHYYDVEGTDVASINRSIARQRPLANGRPLPAAAHWTVKTSYQRRNENGQCRVTNAEATFAATAEFPRLVKQERLKKPLIVQWDKYVEGLEANELPTLIFVYSQLETVEKAILATSCEEAAATGARAVERLKSTAADFEEARQKQMRRTERMFEEAGWFNSRTDKPICKSILATGSRLNTLRVCMSPREWEILRQGAEKVTRDMQDLPRANRVH